MSGHNVVNVLGVPVDAVDTTSALQIISRWIANDQHEYVCVTGAHGIVESMTDESLMNIHKRAGLVVPDGRPLVWAGKYAGCPGISQVRGQDLMAELVNAAADHSWKCYFYGGSSAVVEKMIDRLLARIPTLQVSGYRCPPFRELTTSEFQHEVTVINAADPQLVLVGMSTPKQERWMARVRPLLNANALVGIGAAFDMHAGVLPVAPRLMQRMGLEWLYRLASEPRRLWPRYSRVVPKFIVGIVRHPPATTVRDL